MPPSSLLLAAIKYLRLAPSRFRSTPTDRQTFHRSAKQRLHRQVRNSGASSAKPAAYAATHQAVGQHMVEAAATIQRLTASQTFTQLRQNRPAAPARAGNMSAASRSGPSATVQHRNGQPKDRIIGFAFGKQFVQGLGHMLQRDHARIIHGFATAATPECRKRPAAPAPALRDRRSTARTSVSGSRAPPKRRFDFFAARATPLTLPSARVNKRHQQVSLAQRIGSQHDRFRLLQ